MSSFCLLVYIVCDEKSAINLLKVSLYMISHFPLASFWTFFFFSFKLLYDVSGPLYVCPTWSVHLHTSVDLSFEQLINQRRLSTSFVTLTSLTRDISVFTYVRNHWLQALVSVKIPLSIMC